MDKKKERFAGKRVIREKIVSAALTESEAEKLDDLCIETNQSRSDFIRQAVVKEFENAPAGE
jgi:metal-responsive CopG/Arc/MetJ family transcriptional regulator